MQVLKSFTLDSLPTDTSASFGQVLLQDSGKNGFSIPSFPNVDFDCFALQISKLVRQETRTKTVNIQIKGIFEHKWR